MQVKEIVITPVAFKEPPLRNAIGIHGPFVARSIVQVIAERGQTGLGETYGDRETVEALRKLAPSLRGISVYDLNGLRTAVEAGTQFAGTGADECVLAPESDPRRRTEKVYGALEVAFLDVQARIAGVPLCDWLGGRVREQVPFSAYLFFKEGAHPNANYSRDDWGEVLSPAALVEEARRLVRRHGFRSIKLKGGVLDPEQEVACMHKLKSSFPDCPLRIDPNGNWTLDTARRMCDQLTDTLEYLEDPCASMSEMAALHREKCLPLATNMVVTTWEEIPENVACNASQVILADHHYWGGLIATKNLAKICEVFDMGLSMHSNAHLGISLMAMTHVAASIRNLTYACDTHYPWGRDDEYVIRGGRIVFEDGAVRIKNRPGLGIEIDPNALAHLHAQYEAGGEIERDDVKQMRMYDSGWSGARPRF